MMFRLFLPMMALVAQLAVAQDVPVDEFAGILGQDRELSIRDRERLDLLGKYRLEKSYAMLQGNRISYLFGHGEPSLVCAPMRVCLIGFEAGERLVPKGILIGDSSRWTVIQSFVDRSGVTYLAFKPVEVGLETSLTVITDRRMYHMELISTQEDYMPIVTFRYPQDPATDEGFWERYQEQVEGPAAPRLLSDVPSEMATSVVADLNWNYEIGPCDCLWRPERVYDDGIRTVIDLPASSRTGDLPVLLITGANDEDQLSNYRVMNNRFVVDQLFDEARLALGTGRGREEVVIRRKGL